MCTRWRHRTCDLHYRSTIKALPLHCVRHRKISDYENCILACISITGVDVLFYIMHSHIHYLYNDAYATSRYQSGCGRCQGWLGEETGTCLPQTQSQVTCKAPWTILVVSKVLIFVIGTSDHCLSAVL